MFDCAAIHAHQAREESSAARRGNGVQERGKRRIRRRARGAGEGAGERAWARGGGRRARGGQMESGTYHPRRSLRSLFGNVNRDCSRGTSLIDCKKKRRSSGADLLVRALAHRTGAQQAAFSPEAGQGEFGRVIVPRCFNQSQGFGFIVCTGRDASTYSRLAEGDAHMQKKKKKKT